MHVLCPQVMGQTVCLGADVLDRARGAMTRFVAPVTMLATGGAGQVWHPACSASCVLR